MKNTTQIDRRPTGYPTTRPTRNHRRRIKTMTVFRPTGIARPLTASTYNATTNDLLVFCCYPGMNPNKSRT